MSRPADCPEKKLKRACMNVILEPETEDELA